MANNENNERVESNNEKTNSLENKQIGGVWYTSMFLWFEIFQDVAEFDIFFLLQKRNLDKCYQPIFSYFHRAVWERWCYHIFFWNANWARKSSTLIERKWSCACGQIKNRWARIQQLSCSNIICKGQIQTNFRSSLFVWVSMLEKWFSVLLFIMLCNA